MRIILLHLLLLLFSITLPGQVALDTTKIKDHIIAAQGLFSEFKFVEAEQEGRLALSVFEVAPDTILPLKGGVYRVLGGALIRQGRTEEARVYLKKALEVYHALSPINYEFIAQINSNIGISYVQKPPTDFESAIPWFNKAAETIQKSDSKTKDMRTMDYLGNVGMAHYYLDQFELAEKKYLEALDYMDTTNQDRTYIAMMEARLGMLYQKKGNRSQAIPRLEQAIKHYQLVTQDAPFVADILVTLSEAYRFMGDYEKALLYAEQAQVMTLKTIGAINEEYITTLNAKSNALEALGRMSEVNQCDVQVAEILEELFPYPTPAKFYNQALRLERETEVTTDLTKRIRGLHEILVGLKNLKDPVEEEIAGFTLDLGGCYLENGQLEAAKDQLLEALRLQALLYKPYSDNFLQTYAQLAALHIKMDQPALALQYFAEAEKAAGLHQTRDVNTLSYPILTANNLGKKAAFILQQYPEREAEADSLYQLAQQILEQVQTSVQGQHTKIGLQDAILPILEGRLDLLYENYEQAPEPETAAQVFQLMERGNSFILLQAVQQSRITQFSQVPPEILNLETKLRENIAFYQKELYLLQQKEEPNQTQVRNRVTLLATFKRQADSLEQIITKDYPKYHQLKYRPDLIPLAVLQKQLAVDQTMLSYFVGENHLYCLKIEKTQIIFKRLALDFPINDWVTQLRKGLTTPQDVSWSIPAHQLYNKIMKPLGKNQKRLLIIPHGILSYIPFEVLAKKPVQAALSQADFLLKHHAISYNFSASLWEKMHTITTQQNRLLAFAPSFYDTKTTIASTRRDDLGPLIFNQQEVENIQQFYPSKIFKDTAASLQQFLSHANQYSLLHLATHAKLEDQQSDYSYLAFSGIHDSTKIAKLFIQDLYNLDLPLNMVVLSACETGIGTLKNGEGLMSLARGFTYAGAKSIITSLWTANDLTTAQIMTVYYANLRKGLPKDIAIQQAKLQFLQDHETLHPYYWATFVAMGNMDAVKRHRFPYWPYSIGLMVLLIVSFFLFYLKNLNSHYNLLTCLRYALGERPFFFKKIRLK